jgi:hypothetical protein
VHTGADSTGKKENSKTEKSLIQPERLLHYLPNKQAGAIEAG